MINKVVCINNVELIKDFKKKSSYKKLPLTIGKTYTEDLENKINMVKIIEDDNGETKLYNYHHFVTLSVWREMQLNKVI
jgi:hypothetical protein